MQDGNGSISKEELQEIMGGTMNEDQWKEILADCDKNGDGLVIYIFFINSFTDLVAGVH